MRKLVHVAWVAALTTTLTITTTDVATGAPSAAPAAPSGSVTRITDRVAHALAVELSDGTARATLASRATTTLMDPAGLDHDGRFAPVLARANADVLVAKGLPAESPALLRVRLGDRSMLDALRHGAAPLVAATPNNDDATAFTAYEVGGHAVSVATRAIPTTPVVFVDLDADTAVRLGMAVIHERTGQTPVTPAQLTAGGFWATQLTRIRVNDDEEPWFKGAAEMYAIVGGFGTDGHVVIDTVQMPYLDYDGTDYYPNQLVVFWNHYHYNVADLVLMEDDGDTNYSALAQAIATALLTILDQGAYVPLVNAILNAIPTSWWTDDPDYVESWYTLTTTTSGTFNGARGNGVLAIRPYWVAEQ